MPPPYEKLRDADEDEKRATVTETDGTIHEECVVNDFTRVRTDRFEVWRFILHCEGEEIRLFGPDLETVEVLD